MLDYSIRHIDLGDQTFVDDFIASLKKKFSRSDFFTTSSSLVVPYHYHLHLESRFFLEGSATFIINDNKLVCAPGDYIQIGPKVIHRFEYDGESPLKVMRFFSEGNEWKSYYT
jgi:cupin superfamily acireductone dioxygenase involved in methionine salvage